MQSNVNIARFIRILDDLDRDGIRIPGLILSHPGFGKTTTVEAYCRYKDYNLITIIPSQNAADDILGLQSVDPKTGELSRLSPSWFNRMEKIMENGKRTILFIDEISTCDPFIQAPLLNLIFKRDLGEKTLADNVFILAAGNYSGDLDGVFKMNAPLLNRFLLLNLWNEDFDVMEIFDDKLESLTTKEEFEDYFKFKEEAPTYNFKAFVSWLKEDRELTFSKTTEYSELPELGILGFASIRSINYSLKFINRYMNTYSDDLWMRIAGDSLGYSPKREGKPMRAVFETNADRFRVGKTVEELRGLSEICQDVLNKDLTAELLKELSDAINNANLKDFSNQDLKKFSKVVTKYDKNKDIVYLNDILTKKIVSSM